MAIGEAFIAIRPLLKNFEKDLKKGATPAAKRAGDVASKSFGDSFKQVAKFAGPALVGIGAVLTKQSREFERSQRILRAAVTGTGRSFEGFRGGLNRAIKTQERFGNNATEVSKVLTVLTRRLQDPKKALKALELASDLAAAKQISLADATGLATKILSGNARALKEFGVNVKDSEKALKAEKTAVVEQSKAKENLAKATQDLSDKERILRARAKLSRADLLRLTTAERALTLARKKGKQVDVTRATEKLLVVREALSKKTKLSVTDEIALRKAHEEVTTASVALATATRNVKTTNAEAKGALAGTAEAVAKVRAQVKGLAEQEAATFEGRLRSLQTKLENFAAQSGKLGPVLLGVGTALSTVASVAANLAAVQDSKLAPSLARTAVRLLTVKIAASGTKLALAGTVGAFAAAAAAGVLLGVGLNRLVEKNFPGVNRALEHFGGNLFDFGAKATKIFTGFFRNVGARAFDVFAGGLDLIRKALNAVLGPFKAFGNILGKVGGAIRKAFDFMIEESPVPLAEGIKESMRALRAFNAVAKQTMSPGGPAFAGPAGFRGGFSGSITVNQVANDPEATARAVAARLGQRSTR